MSNLRRYRRQGRLRPMHAADRFYRWQARMRRHERHRRAWRGDLRHYPEEAR